jgi:hypothetical protein
MLPILKKLMNQPINKALIRDHTGLGFSLNPQLYICFYFPQKISTALLRDHTGLGFSIAGGRESIPFKCNDQICSQYYSIIT